MPVRPMLCAASWVDGIWRSSSSSPFSTSIPSHQLRPSDLWPCGSGWLRCYVFSCHRALPSLSCLTGIRAKAALYLWSKEVFGDFHGFIAGWAYLTTNVFYIPFVLLYLLGIGLYVGGPRARMVIDKPLVAFPAVLCALFLITVVNVVGVRVGKLVNNLGGMGTLLAAAVLVGMSAWSFGTHGTNLHPSDLRAKVMGRSPS